MKTVIKKGKVGIEYKRDEKYSTPEKFMTYAYVMMDKSSVVVIANYTPRKKNAAVAKANELYPNGFVYKHGVRVRIADNGVYTNQAQLDASLNKYRAEYMKNIA